MYSIVELFSQSSGVAALLNLENRALADTQSRVMHEGLQSFNKGIQSQIPGARCIMRRSFVNAAGMPFIVESLGARSIPS
jgi:hypothetical protein